MSTELMTSTKFEEFVAPIKDKALSLIDERVFTRECGFALQAINASDKLRKAEPKSLLMAIYNISLTGLSLNPVHKLAYLIPRFRYGQVIASLEPSYQGLIKLLTDTQSVKNVYAHVAHKEDEFQVSLGTNTEIRHVPKFKSKDPEFAYAVAILHDGSKQIEVMTVDEVNAIREKAESYKAYLEKKIDTCIWVDHYDEMARKTVIKRLAKYLPKTERWDKFNQAVNIDNEDFVIGDQYAGFLESLVETSTYSPEKQKQLVREIYSGMNTTRADDLKMELMANQRDPITSGDNYGQGDIQRHLDKLN